jgi:hypothetical protein
MTSTGERVFVCVRVRESVRFVWREEERQREKERGRWGRKGRWKTGKGARVQYMKKGEIRVPSNSTLHTSTPRKADKEDIWCSLTPRVKANGALLVVFWHKRETYFSDWVIRGSGKLHCVRFIARKRYGECMHA